MSEEGSVCKVSVGGRQSEDEKVFKDLEFLLDESDADGADVVRGKVAGAIRSCGN